MMRFPRATVVALSILAPGIVAVAPPTMMPVASVAAAPFISGSSAYQAVAPSRLADTRPEEGAFGFTRISANVIRVKVADRGGVPANATAAVLNITGVNTSRAGFATVYPSGTALPTASNVNFDHAGQVMANMVTVKLGGGSVDVYTQFQMDVAIDVSGAYVPVAGPVARGRLITRPAGAYRVLDTRDRGAAVPPGGLELVNVASAGVPVDAVAVAVNVTATETGIGYWTAFPSSSPARTQATSTSTTSVRLAPARPSCCSPEVSEASTSSVRAAGTC